MQISGLFLGLPLVVPPGDASSMAFVFTLEIEAGVLPMGSFDLSIEFAVHDADQQGEAELYCNTLFIETLWAGGNSRANGIDSVQQVIIPGDRIIEGRNDLEVVQIKSGAGFEILHSPAPTLTILTAGSNPAVSPLFVQAADAFTKLSQEL